MGKEINRYYRIDETRSEIFGKLYFDETLYLSERLDSKGRKYVFMVEDYQRSGGSVSQYRVTNELLKVRLEQKLFAKK